MQSQLQIIRVATFLILLGCSTKKEPVSVEIQTPVEREMVETTQLPQDTNEVTEFKESDAFLMVFNGQKYSITRSGKYQGNDWFGSVKYGLQFNNEILLKNQFDKIGSPNALALSCVEVVSDGKSGLYNLKNHSLLEPQFELLLPHNDSSKNTLFALDDKVWHLLNTTDFSDKLLDSFSLSSYLRTHKYDVSKVLPRNCLRFIIGPGTNPEYPLEMEPYLVTPHYLTKLQVLPEVIFCGNNYFTEPYVETIASRSFGKGLVSLIVAIYDQSFNVRDMELEKVELLVLNEEEETNRQIIDSGVGLGYHDNYSFINDSTLEVKGYSSSSGPPTYSGKTIYRYIRISGDKSITSLKCNRAFNFTFFTEIDSSYFMGTFISSMTDQEKERLTQPKNEAWYFTGEWVTSHLSMDDLDLMRNEIFADYGYKFKTEKWKNYFSTQEWYCPLHDDVNHLLSDRDRHNVKMILDAKARLEENRVHILNRKPNVHSTAG